MSLYDKAKVIFSAAAGAGNKDVAYNIKPVEKLKVDEVLESPSDFSSGGPWNPSSSITVANSVATFTGSGYMALYQNNIFEEGKVYKISVTTTIRKGEGIRVGTGQDSQDITGSNTPITTDGSHSFYFTGQGETNDHRIVIRAHNDSTAYDFDVSNFSVREVEQKANDFSFVRASDLTATYEGADGLIKKTRENNLTNSNDFSIGGGSGGWYKTVDGPNTHPAVVSAATVSGYDGTTNAWKLEAGDNPDTTDDLEAYIRQPSTNSGVQTFSVYARGGNVDYVRLIALGNDGNGNTSNANAFFELTGSGTKTYSNNVIDTNIEKITGGDNPWYRCSITFDRTLVTGVRIQVADGNGNSDGFADSSKVTEGDNIYIQDAQLEYGLVATPYIHRTDSYSKSTAGIQEDEPRYDYSLDNDAPPVLMLEPERQNLVSHSEYISEFSGSRTTVTHNYGTSPDGFDNSSRMVNTTDDGGHRIYTSQFDVTLNSDYTISVFAKKGSRKIISMELMGSNESYVGFDEPIFNLDDASISGDSSNAFMEDYGNGWYRCGVTSSATSVPSTGKYRMYLYLRNDLSVKNYVGSTGDNVELYGMQVEKGSCVTSYIPTYGSAATRETDTIPQYTPSSTNLDKYTFFVHSHSDRVTSDNRAPRLKGDGNSALMGIFVNTAGKKQFFLYDNENNSALSKATFGSFEAGDDTKYAFVVDNIALEAKLFIDGVLRETISLTERVDAKIIAVGNSDGNPDRIKSIMYFPEALEDADAVSLTTI